VSVPRAILLGGLLASWALLAFACSVDDSNPVVPRRNIDELTNDGQALDANENVNGAPICSSYGGISNVKSMALAVLQTVKLDCRISATVVRTQSDNHAIQCLQAFVAASFQCAGLSLSAGIKDDEGVACSRPLDDTLSGADFDAFVADYRSTLIAKGVSEADVDAVLPALQNARAQIVGEGVQEGKYTSCAGNCRDAGGAACNRDAGSPVDAGNKDSGIKDAGPKDTGPPVDSGPKDTGAPVVDSGPKDTGAPDADTGP